MKKIRLATVFSGIGSIEFAFKRLNIPVEIVFACDNGEREIEYDKEKEMNVIRSLGSPEEKKNYVENLYSKKTRKHNFVKETYCANYKIKDNKLETPLYGAYVIVSGSMEPLIKVRDAVLIKRTTEENIKINDVVTYRSTDPAFYGILVTHRVINIEENNGEKTYITKGDHNETIDRTPVKFNQIQGKVIMQNGKINNLKG